MSAAHRAATVAVVLTVLAAGCAQPPVPRDVDPAAKPGAAEQDRLQKIVNARPDLDTVRQQLAQIASSVRATIDRHAPQSGLSHTPDNGTNADRPGAIACVEPFNHTVGQAFNSGDFLGGVVSDEQWKAIVAELAPVFSDAGLTFNDAYAPPGPGDQNDSQKHDDTAGNTVTIDLLGRYPDKRLRFTYRIGCHLPAAWRTGPAPVGFESGQGPGAHFPYLADDGRVEYTYSPGTPIETP